MTKFAGLVGFASGQTETRPGIFEEAYEEHLMRGDVIKASKVERESSTRYDTLALSNRISVVGDRYAYENFMAIRYVRYMGGQWKVTGVDVEKPRLILTLGDVYHE